MTADARRARDPGDAMSPPEAGPLRRLRVAAGLSQQETARRSGMSVRALRYLENGSVTRPQASSIRLLAEVLGVPAQELAQYFAPDSSARGASPRGVSVEALGPLVLRRDGNEVPLGPPMRRSLLGLLAVQPGRLVGVGEIVAALWPTSPPATCRQLVHTYVSGLRRLLDGAAGVSQDEGVLRSSADGYRLELDEESLDVARFERLSAQGHEAVASHAFDSAAQLFSEAWLLWRGPMPTSDPRLAQHPAVVRLVQLRAQCVLGWADAAFILGRYGQVAPALRILVDENPLEERAAARLVLALAGEGRQAEALAAFERTRDALDEGLGVRPGAELKTAHLRVLRGQLPPTARRGSGAYDPPAQLPADASAFVGRAKHLAALDAVVGADGLADRVVLITGMPGAGKTALALHWGHRMRERFPDGQLYVDLRGHSREAAVPPTHALGGFLQGLGVGLDQVPDDAEQAAAAYRSRLADRKVLVVLDNAASAEQVRPLLPGSAGSLALITSRHRLGGLVAREAARVLALAPLAAEESHRLLVRLLGAERALAEPEAVIETAELCAQLPLALRIAAANLATRPEMRIARFNDRLRTGDRLGTLEVSDDADTAVRAAFQLSCDELPDAERRMFRLLALMPGSDAGVEPAAAMAGIGPHEAERHLRRLTDRHLVFEPSLDRYALHDLLRLHARQLSWPRAADARPAPGDPSCGCADAGEHAGLIRLARHQRDRLAAAARLLYPHLLQLPDDPSDPAAVNWNADDARAWLEREHSGVLALTHRLSGIRHHQDTWRLTDLLSGYFMLRGSTGQWAEACEAAYATAQSHGSAHVRAAMQMHTAVVLHFNGQPARAAQRFHAAAETAREAAWLPGEAVALNNLAICQFTAGEPGLAIAALEQALARHRQAGRIAGEAVTLSNLGAAFIAKARERATEAERRAALRTAINYLNDGLALHRTISDRRNEAETLRALAEAHRDAGRLALSLSHATEAIQLARETQDRRFEAAALCLLGTIHARLGQVSEALAHRAQGLDAAAQLHDPGLEGEASLAAADTSAVLGLAQDALVHLDNARVLARQIGSGQLERRCGLLARRMETADESGS